MADASGGIAVLVTDGAFPRGVRLRLTGELDDRFAQRTLRVDGADVVVLGAGADPAPISGTTGGVGEAVEGRLVRIGGVIAGAGSVLTSGIAFDVDDGSGVTRIVVGSGTDIDASAWGRGTHVGLAGVVGQRDSSGEGIAGYRVMPRDPADVTLVAPPATPEPPRLTSFLGLASRSPVSSRSPRLTPPSFTPIIEPP